MPAWLNLNFAFPLREYLSVDKKIYAREASRGQNPGVDIRQGCELVDSQERSLFL